MKQDRTKQILRLIGWAGCIGFGYASVALAKEDLPPSVTVGVHAQHSGDKIVYQYRVTNNTPQNVASIAIGRDSRGDSNPANDSYELLERPSGWNLKLGVPSTSSNAPTGWRVSLSTAEEETPESASPDKIADPHAVIWEPLNDKSPKLLTGQSMSKLSITVDRADTSYLTGHALISFAEGSSDLTVPIERMDNTPPTLTVNLSPNTLLAQNDKTVAVRASFTVQDDYDHMPRIKLESITTNEAVEAGDILDASLGLDDRYIKFRAVRQGETDRIYTVTYSATDASGNQTLASATVTVTTSEPVAITPAVIPAVVPTTVPTTPQR